MKIAVFAALATCLCLTGATFADDTPLQPYHSAYLRNPSALETTDKAKGTPATFVVPDRYASDVWGEAQSLIAGWTEHNPAVRMMKIQIVNDNIIQTYNPDDGNVFGFTVSSVKAPTGKEITIKGMYSEKGSFTNGKRDAGKRASLLSFLLQEYLKEIESAPSDTAAKPDVKSKLAPEIDAMLTSIRVLLEAKQNDAALAQIETLKTLLKSPKPDEVQSGQLTRREA